MSETYKKGRVTVLFVFFFVGISAGLALATTLTVDGKEDAGLDSGLAVFAKFVDASDPNNTLLTVLPTDPPFLSASDAYAFAFDHKLGNWSLQSAGNIWSTTDPTVGESLSGLDAGTYRIAPTGGAYMYDSWGWDPNYNYRYWWQLQIRADEYSSGQIVNSLYAMLGSATPYGSAGAAFQAVQGSYLDITLAQGGSLNFWIWDWNSIDNSGGLDFSVTRVPETSTFMLLALGLPFLLCRTRK
jgi:hypothetical protein